MKRALAVTLLLSATSCADPPPTAPPLGSAAPQAAVDAGAIAAQAPSASGARWPELTPKKLARKATPSAVRSADEAACSAGKADACRRMADRYRGYGATAGCGLDRGRPRPFIKTIAEDTDRDERAYTAAIGRACELGDADACALAKAAFLSYRLPTSTARLYASRSAPEGLGILRFRERATPEWTKPMLDARQTCLTGDSTCWGNEQIYFRRDVKPKEEPKLSAERATLYEDVCRETHDCDDLWMMLDKDRYPASDVAKIRASFASSLTEGCLAGECTCGHAARYLDEADPAGLDLAILGCEDGEAEGCYELARRLEEGRGLDKDETRALALYHLACPDMHPRESEAGPRMGEYSKRACDRLADLAAGSTYPPKDWDRAMYYAHLACTQPGVEVDHAACVRLGRFWASNPKSTGRNGEDARDAAYGPRDGLFGMDCARPSVKDACDAFDASLAAVK